MKTWYVECLVKYHAAFIDQIEQQFLDSYVEDETLTYDDEELFKYIITESSKKKAEEHAKKCAKYDFISEYDDYNNIVSITIEDIYETTEDARTD